jgi:hypothetical protein
VKWDLDRIHGKGYTDNVDSGGKVEPPASETQQAMQRFACMGNSGST